MKKLFKKALSIAGSLLMVGASVGMAAATAYPAPFNSGSTAVVVGASAAGSDAVAAANIGANVVSATTITIPGDDLTTSGEIVSLDSSSTRIWLNTSLNTAKTQLTKTNLPILLADTTFSGNVDAKITTKIVIGDGAAAGGDNSNKVIFTKQPRTSSDPVIGVSLGTSLTNYLYNATATFKNINFSHSDSEGETISLFGKDYVISTATDKDTLVLFSSAQSVNLVAGGSSPSATANVEIDGVNHVIELVTGSDTTATIAVDGVSKEVSEGGANKRINGIDIAIKSVTESAALNTITATVLVGSQTLTFEEGAKVTVGSDADPIDGTRVSFAGGTPGTDGLTELTISVFRPSSSEDAILAGTPFVDPVYGSFKFDFVGLSSPLDDVDRDIIAVENSGDDTMSLTMTDSSGTTKTFDFAHNESSFIWLGDESNYSIKVMEWANLTENQYIVVGNEDSGHLLQVATIYNNTGTTAGEGDKVTFKDVISGDTYTTDATSTEGTATLTLPDASYTVTYVLGDDAGSVRVKYPTSVSASADVYVVYPTIQTQSGANVALYEPLTINLSAPGGSGVSASTTLRFPDGDGYTDVVFADIDGMGNWTVTGGGVSGEILNTSSVAINDFVDFVIGELTYNITALSNTGVNMTKLYVTNPETASASAANIDRPGIIIFEGKDKNNEYNALIVDLEDNAAGDSDSGVGVNDVLFSYELKSGHYSSTLKSNTKITQDLDWYGTLVTTNAEDSDQKYVEISLPDAQVYSQIYVGGVDSSVTGGTTQSPSGDVDLVTVEDSEIDSVKTSNLIVVGGTCINSVAAALLGGGSVCGADFTTLTDVAASQYLIETVASSYTTGKVALLVAGYEAADTTKAATYLVNNAVDTTVGMKYIGTSATNAEVVIA